MKWRCKNEKGFTLVEVLASVVIISIILIGVFNFIIFSNKTVVSNNEKLVAINLGKATLERLKIKPEDFFPLPSQSLTPPYVGRDAANPVPYDGSHCSSHDCMQLYNVLVNDVTYSITVEVSQNSYEMERQLINTVVTVKHSDNESIKSVVEGYISYDSSE